MTAAPDEDEGIPNVKRKLPFPTQALPGTSEKMHVLRERAKRGEWLFHPDDAQPAKDGSDPESE